MTSSNDVTFSKQISISRADIKQLEKFLRKYGVGGRLSKDSLLFIDIVEEPVGLRFIDSRTKETILVF